MKKILAIIMIFMIVWSVSAMGAVAEECSDWAKTEVEKAKIANIADWEIAKDYGQDITRSEFCALVVNTYTALDLKSPAKFDSPFTDTSDYRVDIAYTLGIVNGVSEDEFAPDKKVSREEMAVMMSRLANIIKDTHPKADLSLFEDHGSISDWATDAMEYMVGAGIIKGVSDTQIAPEENTTREQAIVMAWRLYVYLGGRAVPMLEETTIELLSELNIVDKEKLSSSDNLTVYEALVAIDKARGCYSEEIGNLYSWYAGDTLAHLDNLEDSKKSLLLSLSGSARNRILSYPEIADIQLDESITNYEAVLYILRMVGDTYGCTDDVITNLGTDKNQIYEMAYKKGLISSSNADNAQGLITYKEFCDMLYKALFVSYNAGGAGGVYPVRTIDSLLRQQENEPETPEVEKKLVEIPVVAHMNDDMSCTWILPDEYSFIAEEKYFTSYDLIDKEEKITAVRGTGATETSVDALDIISCFVHNDPQWAAMRCTYSKSGNDTEYYFDIDISKIRVVTAGAELKPGKYITRKDSWCAKEITLAEGNFEAGCYYVIKDYEKTYRKNEYNSVDTECFKADRTSDVFVAPTDHSFGVSKLDEIHIQKIEVSGNPQEGFVLTITPESTNVFVIEETE